MSNSTPAADQPADPTRRKRRLRRIVAIGIVLLVLGMFAVVNLDVVGHRWVQCQVVESNAEQGDMNSASAFVVVLETKDCGRVLYDEGVNRDNVEDKAAEFEPGQYEMKMGLTSQWAAEGIIPGINPSFEEYRPAQ